MLPYDEIPGPLKILNVSRKKVYYINARLEICVLKLAKNLRKSLPCPFGKVRIAADGFLWHKSDVDEVFLGKDTVFAFSRLATLKDIAKIQSKAKFAKQYLKFVLHNQSSTTYNSFSKSNIPKIEMAGYQKDVMIITFENHETRYLLPEFLPEDEHIRQISQPHIWPYISFDNHSIFWDKYLPLNERFEAGNDTLYYYSKPISHYFFQITN